MRLFAPRPPLPYLKPLGRDPDAPLKHRAKPPPTLSIYETLALVKEEKLKKEEKALEEGENPDAEEEGVKAEEEKEEGEEKKGVKKEEVDDKKQGLLLLPQSERLKVKADQRKKRHDQTLAEGIKQCTFLVLDILPCLHYQPH